MSFIFGVIFVQVIVGCLDVTNGVPSRLYHLHIELIKTLIVFVLVSDTNSFVKGSHRYDDGKVEDEDAL